MNSQDLALTVLFLGCMGNVHASEIEFCVRPGNHIEEMAANCRNIQGVTEHTEEGEVISYVVTSNGFVATVEHEDGRIGIMRFREDPLPLDDVSIGDTFRTVRIKHPNMSLNFGLDEQGYLGLGDDASGVYIAFDFSSLPEGWERKSGDERTLHNARVVAVNWVLLE